MTDHPFAYQVIGEGDETFIWLHGWGQTSASLERLARLFKNRGKHILFDLPGFGETPMLQDGAGTRDYADALAANLDALGVASPCIIIGHSFGARVATQLAAHHGDKVKAMVYIAGAGLKRRRSFGFKIRSFYLRMLGKLARTSDKLFKTTKYQSYTEKYGSRDYKAAGDLRPTFVRVVNEDLVEEARNNGAPTLLLYTTLDNEAPPEIGKKYARLMTNATYHELDGYAHLDILDRGAYQCQALIEAFLKDNQL